MCFEQYLNKYNKITYHNYYSNNKYNKNRFYIYFIIFI